MARYALGIDYGTSSCRSLVVDLADGREIAEAVYAYPSGQSGVVVVAGDPDVARQEPADYLAGLEDTVRRALLGAASAIDDFVPAEVVAVGFATTGSTPIPIDDSGTALALLPEFADNLAAKAWLWKDHTAHREAAAITEIARRTRPDYIDACGGTYSAEWFWAKIWHCLDTDRAVFDAATSWVELCDYLVGELTGTGAPDKIKRSITAAGHKAMYSDSWGGLPDTDFLASLAPELADLRGRLYETAVPTTDIAGYVTAAWAERTGLEVGTPVAVGHFDAHAAGVSAGARAGVFVKVMGTSTCDVTVIRDSRGTALPSIPGMCGVVRDSMIPGQTSVESGQSAVGDIFNWFAEKVMGDVATLGELSERATQLAPGEHGLLALDWFNGNRSVLVDQRLTGAILGLTLHTEPHHILRALVEATAFGARRIIEAIEASGNPLDTIVAAGGLPSHAPWIIQAYADVFGREIVTSRTTLGSALGAAIVAAVAAGEFSTVEAAQDVLVHYNDYRYHPDPTAVAVYDRIYAEFLVVHDAFAVSGQLGTVMKNMLEIRDATTSSTLAKERAHA
jgi:L-ribulokinase